MMRLIEPCCYPRQIGELINECEARHSSAHFFSYSDWDVNELLETLAGYAVNGEMGIAMVRFDLRIIATIRKILNRIYPDPASPSSHIRAVTKMVLVTQPISIDGTFDHRKAIRSELGRYIKTGQLIVCEDNIGFRCISLKGEKHTLVVQGSLNTQKSGAMQMFTISTSLTEYNNVAEMFESKARTKNIFRSMTEDQ